MKKTITIKEKTIKVWERRGLFGGYKISPQKAKFDQDCKTMMIVFAKKAKANKLPANAEEIIAWVNQSYKNCEASFTKNHPYAVVLDVDLVLDELVK